MEQPKPYKLNQKEMTLYLYRGNLDKPIKLTYSDNPQF